MQRDVVTAISNFARRYRAEKKLTPRQLYDLTGYEGRYLEITQEAIESVLSEDPALIDDWYIFSLDKRWTPSWGISKGDGIWTVDYFPRKEQRYAITFTSPIAACALMVRMEMEEFRNRTRSEQ